MGKESKNRKLDKYYKLAKEQGYRARSAFKLIQLDKKFNFLASARCLIDLCAAPGGWMQVAAKYMPPQSLIVGVDLAPIKPIPRCAAFMEDITTDQCRKRIQDHIKDWKADVVLHDGAPNVGAAWAQDAFTQNELVLSSLKLATLFLANGGTFVTKIFRSKDYNNLLWVFNQLFTSVQATKPPSSRNVSAEIFVVCQGYKAPHRIDPKFLNPSYVFKDLDPVTYSLDATGKKTGNMDKLTPAAQSVFHPEKKRKKREGYEDGDNTLHKSVGIMDFVKAGDPIAVLGSVNQLTFYTDEEKELRKNKATTSDIVISASDLKVLGKKDFKQLLKWRTTIRSELSLDAKPEPLIKPDKVIVEPLDEDAALAEEALRREEEALATKRKAKRRTNEKRTKEIQRLQLGMTTPMDLGLERTDGMDAGAFVDGLNQAGPKQQDDIFGLENATRKFATTEEFDSDDESGDEAPLQTIGEEDDEISDEEERKVQDLEANLDTLYDDFQRRRLEKDARAKVREARAKRAAEEGGEFQGFGAVDEDEQSSGDDKVRRPVVSDSETDSEEEEVAGNEGGRARKSGKKLIQDLKKPKTKDEKDVEKAKAANVWYDQAIFKGINGLDKLLAGEDEQSDEEMADQTFAGFSDDGEVSEEEFEIVSSSDPKSKKRKSAFDSDDEDYDTQLSRTKAKEQADADRIKEIGLITAEAMTLAQKLVNGEITKSQLIDDGFNRHAFNDKDELPSWFLDDEMKHFRNNIPVTKEAVQAIRARDKALNARPIKKIAEAKARKKMRTIKRLSKMQKKADVINENADMSEKEKSQQIARLVSRASKDANKKKKEVKLVVAKGKAKGIKGRPQGVKGRYKMVDGNMKKELRATKRIAKRDKKKRR